MRVQRKVSQHCANHVSGHRLKAGQMLDKGQRGYVILIRGGFGGAVNLVSYLCIISQEENCHRLFLLQSVVFVLPRLALFPQSTALASTDCGFLFNRAHFLPIINRLRAKAVSCREMLSFFIMWILPAKKM